MKFVVVAHHPNEANVSLAGAAASLGLPASVLPPRDSLRNLEPGEALLAVSHPDCVEARRSEMARHPLGDHLVVLDDEHLRHGCHYRVRAVGDGSTAGEGVVKGW